MAFIQNLVFYIEAAYKVAVSNVFRGFRGFGRQRGVDADAQWAVKRDLSEHTFEKFLQNKSLLSDFTILQA